MGRHCAMRRKGRIGSGVLVQPVSHVVLQQNGGVFEVLWDLLSDHSCNVAVWNISAPEELIEDNTQPYDAGACSFLGAVGGIGGSIYRARVTAVGHDGVLSEEFQWPE